MDKFLALVAEAWMRLTTFEQARPRTFWFGAGLLLGIGCTFLLGLVRS